jgi:hypothetical protein
MYVPLRDRLGPVVAMHDNAYRANRTGGSGVLSRVRRLS